VKLTQKMLDAMGSALDAALAGDGFNGGDFDGLDPDVFSDAVAWITEETGRRRRRKRSRKGCRACGGVGTEPRQNKRRNPCGVCGGGG